MTSQMPEEQDVTHDWEKAKAETQERQAPEDNKETQDWEHDKDGSHDDSK